MARQVKRAHRRTQVAGEFQTAAHASRISVFDNSDGVHARAAWEEGEWLNVRDGEITIEVDAQRSVLCTMDAVLLGAAALMRSKTSLEAALVMTMPGGFERFFAEVSAANERRAEPDFARLEQLMNQYGMELLGPRAPAAARILRR